LPTGAVAKTDTPGRAVGELKQTRASIETLTADGASASERAASPPTAGQDAPARTDAPGRAHALTERLPDQLFGRTAASTHASPELTQSDQLRLLQRVARAIEAAPQRGGFLRLRLRPPELGALQLEVSLQRGHLTARIETETQQARNVLLEHLPQLRERLAEQGIQVEKFDVDVSSRDSSDTPFESRDANDFRPSAPARRRAAAVSEAAVDNRRTPDLSVYSSPGKLNVVI
jgi:flagellar hook-length control protein FliK